MPILNRAEQLPTCHFGVYTSEVPAAAWLVFSPDSKLLLTVNPDAQCLLWNIVERQLVDEVGKQVTCAAFSPNGLLLLLGRYQELVVLNVVTREIVHRIALDRHDTPSIAAFSSLGTMFAVGGGGYCAGEGWFKCWDVGSGRSLSSCRFDNSGETGVVAIRETIDGQFAAWSCTGCEPGSAFVHDLQSGECLASRTLQQPHNLFPPTFLAMYDDEDVDRHFIDLRSGSLVQRLRHTPPHDGWSVVSSFAGKHIAWINRSTSEIPIYDTSRHAVSRHIALNFNYPSLAFSSTNDDILMTVVNAVDLPGSPNETIFWNVNSGEPIAWTNGHQMWCYRYAVSPDGRWFASLTTQHSAGHDAAKIPPGSIVLTEIPSALASFLK